ncbi:type II secretion system F family protein [Massilia aurea]|jgi:tight adherence protein B|uniref:type II secretion system F family protein n=1 Tax=Massilia aurea TaxID=373040 RepID=UPI00216171FE|nr:type II secretion system F family protein [Massilia aurea]MCS0706276.1 type II secretion system F family protein [Massilia aurea]
MNDTAVIAGISVVIALAAGMLTWLAIDVGTGSMKRYRSSFTERTRFQVREFFLFIDPRQLFVLNMAGIVLGALMTWLFTDSALLALAMAVALTFAPRVLYARLRARRLRQFEEQLPDALMMLAGGMRAGAGFSSALTQLVQEAPAPLGQEFSLMLREQRIGVTLEQSLNNLAHRMPTQTTILVVSAMRIAAETGGGLAETLERTAGTIRSRLQMEGKIRALTAQGKLQAWVVGLLPVGLALVLGKMEPAAMDMLWHTRVGWAVLAVLAVLEALGVYVIRKIIAIDV